MKKHNSQKKYVKLNGMDKKKRNMNELSDEAAQESFPSSDPPAWTSGMEEYRKEELSSMTKQKKITRKK